MTGRAELTTLLDVSTRFPSRLCIFLLLRPLPCFAGPERVVYDLDGVVHHRGRHITSGHYVTFIRNGNTKKWLLFDDSNEASVVEGDVALNKNALVLMYTRRPPP